MQLLFHYVLSFSFYGSESIASRERRHFLNWFLAFSSEQLSEYIDRDNATHFYILRTPLAGKSDACERDYFQQHLLAETTVKNTC